MRYFSQHPLVGITSLLWLLLLTQGGAADTIRVASYPIPMMVEDENTGVFVDLLKEIERRIPHTFEIQVLPSKRTIKMFHISKVDSFFPALDVLLDKPFSRSSNIYVKEDFAFVDTSKTPPISIEQLKNKRIGITAGYPYAAAIMALNDLQQANNDVANVKKLSLNRIDVFVVEEKSGLKAVEQSGVNNVHYNPQAPLSRQDVYFAFQDDAKGEAYAEAFSEALAAMKADGTFAAIMSQTDK